MAKRVIDLPPAIEHLVWRKIQDGTYESFDHLVTLALENQLKAEGNNQNWWLGKHQDTDESSPVHKPLINKQSSSAAGPGPHSQSVDVASIHRLIEIPTEEPVLLEAMLPQDTLSGPLWGQYYRFFPVKPALRVLAHLSEERLPTVPEFRAAACDVAERVGRRLKLRDVELGLKLGDLLSTSLPESTDKSRRRYADQFLIYTRPSDRKHDGLLPRLKFISVRSEGQAVRIGLTEAGLNFSRKANPIIDSASGGISSLSDEEKEFLLGHLELEVPDEADHMTNLLGLIARGVIDRESLNKKMRVYYYSHQDKKRAWTDAHVNTMRAGLQSRLHELGLTSRTKHGLAVSYVLTERGRRFLEER